MCRYGQIAFFKPCDLVSTPTNRFINMYQVEWCLFIFYEGFWQKGNTNAGTKEMTYCRKFINLTNNMRSKTCLFTKIIRHFPKRITFFYTYKRIISQLTQVDIFTISESMCERNS